MTHEEITTIERALDRYIAHLTEHIEEEIAELDRARQLRARTAAEVVRSGDLLHVNTAMLQGWIDRAGASREAVMTVKHISREPDGTKTVIVGFAAVP